jgi:hypothetical protein
MPTAAFTIVDLQGETVSTSSPYPFAVNKLGTSQVLRVGFTETIAGLTTFDIPVTVTPGPGTASVTATLSFSSTAQTALLTITGAGVAGDFSVELGAPDNASGPAFAVTAPVSVSFTNNDSEATTSNLAPTEPTLRSPAEGAVVDDAVAQTFEWTHAFDKDKDELQYSLCFSTNASMTAMRCLSVDEEAIVPDSGVAGLMLPGFYWPGLLVGSMLVVMAWRRFRAPKARVVRRIVHLGAIVAVSALALGGCGGKDLLASLRVSPRPTVSASVPASTLLSPGTMYWRVYADDSKGNIQASSATRSIEVQ